jgi:hypothetical protein
MMGEVAKAPSSSWAPQSSTVVFSVFVSAEPAVSDVTRKNPITPDAAFRVDVTVHRYHPFGAAVIVAVVVSKFPTVPAVRLKLAYFELPSAELKRICRKLFVPAFA